MNTKNKSHISAILMNAAINVNVRLEPPADWSLQLRTVIEDGGMQFDSPHGQMQVSCVDFGHAAHFQLRANHEIKMDFLVAAQSGHEWLWEYFCRHFRDLLRTGNSYLTSDEIVKRPDATAPWAAVIMRAERSHQSEAAVIAYNQIQTEIISWFIQERASGRKTNEYQLN